MKDKYIVKEGLRGYRINRRDAQAMLNDINQSLNAIGTQVKLAKGTVLDLSEESELTSLGYKSIKNYFEDGHGTMLNDIYNSIILAMNENKHMVQGIQAAIQHDGSLDYGEIADDYELYSGYLDQMQNLSGSALSSSNISSAEALASKFESILIEMEAVYNMSHNGSISDYISRVAESMEKFSSQSSVYDEKTGKPLLPEGWSIHGVEKNITQEEEYTVLDLDPVNMASGNYIYTRRFLEIPGRQPMFLEFTYNSVVAAGRNEPYGGWTHNYEIHLYLKPGKVLITTENGKRETYMNKGNRYENASGSSNKILEKCSDDIYAFIYTTENNEKYYFNFEGECLKKIDRFGNRLDFQYSNGSLIHVRNEFGTGYDFMYEYADEDWRIKRIEDTSGRCIVLEFKDIQLDDKVVSRLSCIEDEEDEMYLYGYDRNGMMYKVTNARGTVNLMNEYDINGRVIGQKFPDGGYCTISYNDFERCITAIRQNGMKIRYYHDEIGRSTKTEYDHQCSSEEFTYTENNRKSSFKDKNGNVTAYEYDAYGDIVKETDPIGNVFETVYDENRQMVEARLNQRTLHYRKYNEKGKLTEYQDAIGRTTKIEYSERNVPVKIVKPDGTSIRLSYDARGNIISIADENRHVTEYGYDSINRVVSAMDGNGNVERYFYNRRNELIESVNAIGDHRKYFYNESGKLVHFIDYDGSEMFFEYNEINKVSAVIDKDGYRTEYYYNNMWNLSRILDPEGGNIIYDYDKSGRLIRVTNPMFETRKYYYDANDNVTAFYDGNGNVTIFQYDALNRVSTVRLNDGTNESYEYDDMGNVVKFTDAEGNEWRSAYNLAGELVEEITPEGESITYSYDQNGNVIKECHGEKTRKYTYDLSGQLTGILHPDGGEEKFTYDKNGNLIEEISGGVTTAYRYDALNRIKHVSKGGIRVASYEYDAVGNIVSVKDGEGNLTRYSYSNAGDLLSVTDPEGNITRYHYDKHHEIIAVIRGTGREAESVDEKLLADNQKIAELNQGQSGIRITTYKRDRNGRILDVMDPLGNTENYRYNKNGEVIYHKDQEGNITRVKRNNRGDITELDFGDSKTVQYSYTPLRRLSEIHDSLGTTTIQRDVMGRAMKITDHRGKTVSYAYDGNGNRTSIIYSGGTSVHYEYDEKDRIIKVTAGEKETEFSYDEEGRILSRKSGTYRTEYQYNGRGYLSELLNTVDGSLMDRFRYMYNGNGSVSVVDQYRKDIPEDNGIFSYDYDALNRLILVKKEGTDLRSYLYDAFSNRIEKRENGNSAKYTYNKADQLVSILDAENETIYKYDRRGNLVEELLNGKILNTYSYNAANRLSSAFGSDGKSVSYEYNGLGYRMARREGGKSMEYVLDQTRMFNNLLEEIDGENNREYVWNEDMLLSVDTNRILTDRLNSPIRMNRQGISYDEFGLSGELYSGIGFAGYMKDDITGTYFAQAREYIPETGRFAGRDIIKGNLASPVSLNEYLYCYNNPIKYVDLNGMKPQAAMNRQDYLQTSEDYYFSQGISFEAGRMGARMDYGIKVKYATHNYSNSYSLLKEELAPIREATGNPRAGSGRLSWVTRRYNEKLRILEGEKDAALKMKPTSIPKEIAAAGVKGGIIGGVVDSVIGMGTDYYHGASRSKMSSNAAVNFGFGFVEGAVISMVMVANPAAGFLTMGIIWAFELLGFRQYVKDSINSLD